MEGFYKKKVFDILPKSLIIIKLNYSSDQIYLDCVFDEIYDDEWTLSQILNILQIQSLTLDL